MEKYEIDEKLAESFLYEIAEKRCFAKIVKFFFKINISLFLGNQKLIEDGFAETYEIRKSHKEETKELLNSTKLNYEKKYLERLQKKMKNNKEQSITTTQSSIINEKENFEKRKVEKNVGGITLLSTTTKNKRKRE